MKLAWEQQGKPGPDEFFPVDPEQIAALKDWAVERVTFICPGPDGPASGDCDHALKRIRVLDTKPEQRVRFGIAHELGHGLLHKSAPPCHGGQHLRHDDTKSRRRDSPVLARLEREANVFAAELLMPERALLRAFVSRFGSAPANFLSILNSLSNPQRTYANAGDRLAAVASSETTSGAKSLCAEFDVSPEAMALRLKELGLVRSYV